MIDQMYQGWLDPLWGLINKLMQASFSSLCFSAGLFNSLGVKFLFNPRRCGLYVNVRDDYTQSSAIRVGRHWLQRRTDTQTWTLSPFKDTVHVFVSVNLKLQSCSRPLRKGANVSLKSARSARRPLLQLRVSVKWENSFLQFARCQCCLINVWHNEIRVCFFFAPICSHEHFMRASVSLGTVYKGGHIWSFAQTH